MLTLFTGLPGNGKTLFALTYIKAKAEKENRPVFYNNIKGLTLPWTEIKAEEWMTVPDGSIIVLDECQATFPTKANGAALPKHYEELATHRHKGLDIFLITQHPSLVHNFVRRLVGQHFHSVRKFGFERATIHEWDKVAVAPEDASSQKNAIPLKWSFNKEAYTWYKSAELHTVKKRVPVKIFIALGFVLLVIAAGFWFLSSFDKKASADITPVVPGQPAGTVADFLPPGQRPTTEKPFDPMADAQEYVAMNTPRVSGLPHTAPKYDQITAPVRAPIPAACIQIGSVRGNSKIRCQCYSQQGTKMEVEFNMCIDMAQNGWFRDFDEDGARGGDARQAAPVISQSVPVARVEPAPVVLAFGQPEEPAAPVVASAPAENRDPGRAIRNALPRQ